MLTENLHPTANGKATPSASPQPAVVQPPNPHQDRIPHRRDARGDVIPSSYVYHNPTAGHDPAAGGPFQQVIDEIAKSDPLEAALLRHEYDDKLVKACANVEETRENARQEVRQLQLLALAREKEYEAARAAIEAEKEAALAAPKGRREGMAATLHAAKLEAAESAAKAGATFLPEDPSEDDVLLVAPKSLEAAADELRVPLDPPETSTPRKVLKVCGTVLVGLLIGVSLAIISGAVDAQRIAEKPVVFVVASLAGVAIAAYMGKAIAHAFRVAALATYAQRHLSPRLNKYFLAFSALLCMFAIDVVVERQGILKLSNSVERVRTLSGQAVPHTPELVFYAMAALISFGYLLFYAYEGHIEGRHQAVAIRLKALIEKDLAERTEARRQMSEVRAALALLSKTLVLREKVGELDAEIAQLEAPFDKRLAVAESRLTPYPTDFSEVQEKRMRDAIGQHIGSQDVFDYKLTKALQSVKRRPFAFLKSLFRRKPTGFGREQRK